MILQHWRRHCDSNSRITSHWTKFQSRHRLICNNSSKLCAHKLRYWGSLCHWCMKCCYGRCLTWKRSNVSPRNSCSSRKIDPLRNSLGWKPLSICQRIQCCWKMVKLYFMLCEQWIRRFNKKSFPPLGRCLLEKENHSRWCIPRSSFQW